MGISSDALRVVSGIQDEIKINKGQGAWGRNTEGRSRNRCYRTKATVVTYSVCVCVALVIQHVKGLPPPYYIVICGPSGSTIFFDIIINGMIFGKKVIEHIIVLLQILTETFLIATRILRNIIINILRFSCKVLGYHCHILIKLEFLRHFSGKKAQISYFIKIRPAGTEFSMRTDGHDEVNSRFSQFCERALICGKFEIPDNESSKWKVTFSK